MKTSRGGKPQRKYSRGKFGRLQKKKPPRKGILRRSFPHTKKFLNGKQGIHTLEILRFVDSGGSIEKKGRTKKEGQGQGSKVPSRLGGGCWQAMEGNPPYQKAPMETRSKGERCEKSYLFKKMKKETQGAPSQGPSKKTWGQAGRPKEEEHSTALWVGGEKVNQVPQREELKNPETNPENGGV